MKMYCSAWVITLIVICSAPLSAAPPSCFHCKPKIASTKSEFEMKLSSLFVLYNAHITHVQDTLDVLLEILEKQGNSEEACLEGFQDRTGKVVMKLRWALTGLRHNPYVGLKAQKILNLYNDNNNEGAWSAFDEIHDELSSDLDIADQLGIHTARYRSALANAAANKIMLMTAVKTSTGSHNETSKS